MSRPRTTPTGARFIEAAEGKRLVAYQCSAREWTIGVGHTANAGGTFTTVAGQTVTVVRPGMRISAEEAMRLFNADIDRFEDQVEEMLVGAKVNVIEPHEFDAMVSLAFNIGLGGFKRSTVLRRYLRGDKAGAAAAFGAWNKADGQVNAGLVKRRAAEAAMFNGDIDGAFRRLGGVEPMARRVDRPKPPKTMATSTIGNGAIATGAGGAIVVAKEAKELAEHGAGIAGFLGVPVLLVVGLGIMAIAAFLWWRRRKHLVEDLV